MVLKAILCLVGLLLGAANGQQIKTTETYIHSATLRTENIRLYWKFNETHITFEVHGETTGWIGIGFSPNGGMAGADIFVGWVKDNEVKVTDRHGDGNAFPPLDPKQDIDVLGGTECDGWTMFKFSRQLAACEAEYDREITKSTQRLIWAWSDNDPVGEDIDFANYHGTQRGVESMYFLDSSEGSSGGLPDGPTYETIDIMMNEFSIPAEDTYYNCKLFELPNLGKKHHIVKYEPIIQEGNELHVHHILVYQCSNKLKDPSELLRDERCYSPNMQHFQTCTSVIVAWAVGAEAFIFPEAAGLSIGDDDDPRYIQLEIHYDNPMAKSDIVDSSGIRFTYTETVREHDVGTLAVGSFINGTQYFIPPGANNYLSVSHCKSECIESRMSSAKVEELNVFSVMLHSHLAGRKLKLRHIRDGIELPPLAYDDHYDFNYQETRQLRPYLAIKPTDSLQMECVYNTEDRTNITQGGLGTEQEMCTSFLHYYPKIDFGFCVSSVSSDVLWSYFGVSLDRMNFTGQSFMDSTMQEYWKIINSNTSVSETLLDRSNRYDWNPDSIRSFESFYNSIPHYQFCGRDERMKTTIFTYNVSEIATPYVQPLKKCDEPYLPLSQEMSSTECLMMEPPATSAFIPTTSGAYSMGLSRYAFTIFVSAPFIILACLF